MTFSLRLTADLTLALAARAFGNEQSYPSILQLSPDTNFHTASASFSTGVQQTGNDLQQSSALVSRYRSPIVWISGSEPLDYAEVPRFTNALAASGRSVFLETSGALLKRRLHEFQPSHRFYFTVRFEGLEHSHGQRNAREGAFRVGLEALRMARLAGFLTCALLVMHPETAPDELEQIHAGMRQLDIDGSLITRAGLSPKLEKTVKQLRSRLLSRRWALLSGLVETAVLPAASQNPCENDRQPLPEAQPGDFEEGAEVG
jgi:Radical SAM superfamily